MRGLILSILTGAALLVSAACIDVSRISMPVYLCVVDGDTLYPGEILDLPGVRCASPDSLIMLSKDSVIP